MNVTVSFGSFTSKNGTSYDCLILTTHSGMKIKVVDFNAVQRIRDIIALAESMGVPPDEI